MVKRDVTVVAEFTPQQIAEMFCDMDSEEQAEFLNEVWEIARGWRGAGWCQQSSSIAQSDRLEDGGKNVIAALAEHAFGFDRYAPR